MGVQKLDITWLFLSLLFGLSMGVIYALMAVGLTLIYGVMRIFNLAHGEIYMLGGYLLFVFSAWLNLPMVLSLILSMIISFVFGAFVERVLLSNISLGKVENPYRYAVIVTYALSMILIHSIALIFGQWPKITPDFVSGSYSVFGLPYSGNRLFAFGVAALLIIGLFLFLKKTWTGRALQAVAQSRVGASIVGIDIRKYNTLAFALSSLLAGAAGALLAPVYTNFPTSGTVPVMKGWIVIVLGGMGSIVGSVLGGLVIGVTETLGGIAFGSNYMDTYGFIVLIIILLFRPSGLMGEKVRKA
jgi:branched-chain amino acid transport system permease protein